MSSLIWIFISLVGLALSLPFLIWFMDEGYARYCEWVWMKLE